MSLAIRLLLIVLLAVVPALLVGVYSEYNARQGREAEVSREAVRLAGQLSSEMKQIIEGVQRVALTLAQVPAITDAASSNGWSPVCSRMLAQLGREYPGGLGLGVANADAELVCAANAVPPGTRVTGEHFARAVETGGFVIGGYGEGPNGKGFLSFAHPLFDETGRDIGAIVLGIDLDWLADHMAEKYDGTNASLSMADRNLVYLLRLPEDPNRIVGEPALPEHRGLAALADQGAIEARGSDGVMRVGAITSLAFSNPDAYDLLLGFGVSRDAAFAPIEVATRNALLLLALCLLLALAAAWLGGHYLVRRPAEGLLAAAARWREGEYSKRVEADHVHGELGQLGRAFNDMAMSIEDRTRQLQASEERFRTLAALVPAFVWFADPDGTLRFANERWFAYSGEVAVAGAPIRWAEALHPHDAERALAAWREAIETETAHEIEFRLRDRGGVYRWFLTRAVPLRDDQGRVTGWFGSCTDIEKLTQANEHRALLIEELNHRVKNTLATVQSLAAQSLQGTSLPQARQNLEGRLMALARSQDVLTREYWQSARLREIVEQSVSPSNVGGQERFHIEGPDIDVPPRMALGFSMALHELLVNALKYGALSVDSGTVTIIWSVQRVGSGSRLHLRWKETGGPLVSGNRKKGFGTRLITAGLGRELGGEVSLDFKPEGVVCTFDLPLVKGSSDFDCAGKDSGLESDDKAIRPDGRLGE